MLFPDAADAPRSLSLVKAAFAPTGGLDELQTELIVDLSWLLWNLDFDGVPVLPEAEMEACEHSAKIDALHIVVVLELMEYPLRPEVADSVLQWAGRLKLPIHLVTDARRLADDHIAAMYFDLQRHSWYTHETVHESIRGRLDELARSKLAYVGVVDDRKIARKWESLLDCADGSWGRAVAQFYRDHGFPFPGEKHGIYELGARHDWIHVLAGYETTAEGELDVFAFIASSMGDFRGIVLLGITLGLFQNGAIHHVEGKLITNARKGTLSNPGAIDRWERAFERGSHCTVDVMGTVDLFADKDLPLEEARANFGVEPL
jgi:hypothetical protein